MRFMMLVKSDDGIEKGALPKLELFAAMAKYNDKLKQAGVLIALDGFYPSSKGARVSFSDGTTSVTNGPFLNPKELIAGYWTIQAESLAKTIEWAKQVPFEDGVIEIRQIEGISDFPPEIQKAAGGM